MCLTCAHNTPYSMNGSNNFKRIDHPSAFFFVPFNQIAFSRASPATTRGIPTKSLQLFINFGVNLLLGSACHAKIPTKNL